MAATATAASTTNAIASPTNPKPRSVAAASRNTASVSRSRAATKMVAATIGIANRIMPLALAEKWRTEVRPTRLDCCRAEFIPPSPDQLKLPG
jgi:hypothetical protein